MQWEPSPSARRDGTPAVPSGAGASVRQQNLVDNLDHAIALIDIGDRYVRRATLLVGNRQVLAGALHAQRFALYGLERRLAAAICDLLIKRRRIEAARYDVIGQDLVERIPVLGLQQRIHGPGWKGGESCVGRCEYGKRSGALQGVD